MTADVGPDDVALRGFEAQQLRDALSGAHDVLGALVQLFAAGPDARHGRDAIEMLMVRHEAVITPLSELVETIDRRQPSTITVG